MKLMFIDDEPLVCYGLQNLVEWKNYDFSVVPGANNGEDGLRRLLDEQADVVFLDIRMPGMNGMEVMRRARESGFKGKFILLTGYAEFEYAKESIRYGATEYLLKPVDEEEMVRAVLRAKEQLNRESVLDMYRDEGERREAYLERALRGSLRSIPDTLLPESDARTARLLLIVCDAQHKKKTILSLIGEILGDICPKCCIDGRIAVLLRECSESTRLSLLESIRRAAPEALFFLSPAAGNRESLQELYALCSGTADRAWFVCNTKDSLYLCAPMEVSPRTKVYVNAVFRSLCAYMAALDEEGLRSETQLLYENLAGSGMDRENCCCILMRLYGELNRYSASMFSRSSGFGDGGLEKINLAPCLHAAVDTLLEALLSELPYVNRTSDRDIHQRLMRYIESNYDKPLRLKDIAQRMGYDSAYLGKLLKRETGRSFNGYLESVRLLHARECLLKGLTVSEVAMRCGFSSVEYFSSCFHRAEGVSPSRFRDRSGSNKEA